MPKYEIAYEEIAEKTMKRERRTDMEIVKLLSLSVKI